MVSSADIVNKYISFFKDRGHAQIANSPLVLQNDPTTLFTSSGMQALIPYLLGETHPQGTRLVNVQNCIRTQDIEEVGNNRHTTFFRMIGNWSLGDYFKKEQLPWFFEFLTDKRLGLGLNPEKLYVTYFSGDEKSKVKTDGGKELPLGLDADASTIWQRLFREKGTEALVVDMTDPRTKPLDIQNARIFGYGVKKNWWSRSGPPSNMPPGEPGGPDAEVFYDFGTEHDPSFGEYCHPNCDCGRFMEIGNSVFMQYLKQEDGTFKELPKKNVDFGGGLERLLAAINDDNDVFKTSLYFPIIQSIQKNLFENGKHTYGSDTKVDRAFRIIADHLVAASFLIANGVEPSNKERGYVLRRLIRRAATQKYLWGNTNSLTTIVKTILKQYQETDPKLNEEEKQIEKVILDEESKFDKVLKVGRKAWDEWVKRNTVADSEAPIPPIPAEDLFNLYQSSGVPFEFMYELTQGNVDLDQAEELLKKHQESSRTASAGMFRGGLADHQERTIMGHTATHLLHQALRDVLGNHVHQTGSNITTERIRFDFNYDQKLTDEQMKQVEDIVNEKIKEDLPVHFEMIPTEKAKQMGAIGLFEDTYADTSKIYFIGKYSIEFCGGPHVEHTNVLKNFKLTKQENLGKGQKRVYALVNL